MGWLAKVGGWVWAHKDAIAAGWRIFRALRKRRKETQESGESWKDYYLRKGKNALDGAAEAVANKQAAA